MLNGLAPVHYPKGTKLQHAAAQTFEWKFQDYCGGHLNFFGLQHAEAILYAVDKINMNNTLLPGIKLGVDIRDTCNTVDHAIRECLKFGFIRSAYSAMGENARVCDAKENNSNILNETTIKGVAIIGAAYSGISMAVANLAGLFHVPVVSYASTSRLLSDRSRFTHFLRTVPSDTRQAQTMLDVILAFQWNFVSAVASDTEYGRSGINSFKYAANSRKDYRICIAVDELFTMRTPKAEIREIIAKIRRHPNAKVIVLFAEMNDADHFVNIAREENLTGYIWIGSDAFAHSYSVFRNNEVVLKHWLSIEPTTRVDSSFRVYFQNITSNRLKRNPWLRKYEDYVRKKLNSTVGPVEYSSYTSTAIDAVYAVAHGLHSMYKCSNASCPVDFSTIDQTKVYSYIKTTSFISPTGQWVSFDEKGNAKTHYDVMFVNKRGGEYHFDELGSWHFESGFTIKPQYKNRKHPFSDLQSLAKCSPRCGPGFRKESEKHFPECCWNCLRCRDNTFSDKPGMTSCRTCPDGSRANQNKTSCDVIPPTEIHRTAGGLAVCIVGAFGNLAVLATFILFYRQRETPLVKASSREICYVLLIGLGWCFLVPFAFIIKPDSFICQIRPFLLSTGIAAVIGSLLVKTNRIERIFSLRAMRNGKPRFLSNKWQLVFVWLCVMMENSISATWIITAPPRVTRVINGAQGVTIECVDDSRVGFAIWATLNAALVLVCTYHAFLVRKVPENYNEAKFIAYSMVTVCLSGAVYVPTYLGTQGKYRTILTCFLIIFCCFVTLICLFGPKVYIILFRPEKNQSYQPNHVQRPDTERTGFNRSLSSVTTTSTLSLFGIRSSVPQSTRQSSYPDNCSS